jgi:hypothetical protein
MMIEGPNNGYEAFCAHVSWDAGSEFAAVKSEEQGQVLSLNYAASHLTSQRSVSLVGWSGAILAGASLWTMMFVLVS